MRLRGALLLALPLPDRLEVLLEHLQGGEVSRAGQTHVRDVVLSEVTEYGLGEVLEVGLGGKRPFRGQLGESSA